MNAAIRGIKGKRVIDLDRPEHDVRGPTLERLGKAGDGYAVGDDKMGRVIIQLLDGELERMYSRLTRRAGRYQEEELRREYAALQKYRHHWTRAGKEATIGSVDLNSIFCSDPSRRTGMPMAEGQIHHDQQWRQARAKLNHKRGIVVDNVVCSGNALEIAGFCIGYTSVFRAREAAEKHLRGAGQTLADYWGID
jgi:hypothetical protein